MYVRRYRKPPSRASFAPSIRKSLEEEETAGVISRTARFSGGTKNLRASFGRPKTSPIPGPLVCIPSHRDGEGKRRDRKLPRRARFASLRSSSGSLDFAARRYQLSQPFPAFAARIRRYQLCEKHVRARTRARTASAISISWFSASRSFRSAIKAARRVTQRLRIVCTVSFF